MIIFVGEQFWCLNGSALKNKANIFKTNDTLNLVDNNEGTMFFIRNVSNNNVLSITAKDRVTSKTNATQLWEKRNPNNKTCFIIVANNVTGKVLTATFDGLKAKGNY